MTAVPPPQAITEHDELFAPPGVEWQRISPKWRTVQRISCVQWLVLTAIAAVACMVWVDVLPLTVAVVVAGAALFIWRVLAQHRLWQRWGYAELPDELWITHGSMFRSLTAVPYARLQVVEVESGPLQRAFGLATVKLVTASASTDATIPGLPPAQAAALRDRWTERAEGGDSVL